MPSLDPGSRADLALALLRKELLTDELRVAREIQQRLLPAADLFGDSWSIHGRSFPAGLLAGDFREIVEHPDGTVDLEIGNDRPECGPIGLGSEEYDARAHIVVDFRFDEEARERIRLRNWLNNAGAAATKLPLVK